MGSYNNPKHGSDVLENLAQRLRLYKPTRVLQIPDSVSHETQCSDSKSNSNSIPESDHQHPQNLRRAAVLVCIFQGNNGDLRVILTKRSSTLSSHSGEVALPGGKRDETDADDVETALREAKEEIGLDPSLVNVVAVLEPIFTKHRMIVVPVVGILSDAKAFEPSPCADEVEAIFDAPLEMFLKDENRRAEEKEWRGDKFLLHYFDYEAENAKYLIWALTAGVLIRVASVVYERPPEFLELRPKFWDMAVTEDISTL
ncbi:ARABIDOPSIS THALIANA NUDIX HYDROLASE HOMOLOG 15, nudix hydrolase homolog 15 [Hibiscus trionum]|uniref:ARABIDOPSIS THALIANA NUDIX HYDROLASE HOMOLOG 15, nudix hydrolase homolog 15 n=1 Tax=Hibiscus trionum TaxID=183268 RepID=A0A9W7LQH5_HIBTR|nr:ARABIDOPSIS THALIANA NUDIX HYDROLASE HOMOLOG 15, nudix hydrolase homolog 15 [Hibiscus trionum]